MQLQTANQSKIAVHEHVRVWTYRILEKQYDFHNQRIVPASPMTFGQRLFCLLFPLALKLVIISGLIVLWGTTLNLYASIFVAPWWNHGLLIAWVLLLFYGSVRAGADMLYATWLISDKLRKQPERDAKNY